MRRDIAFALAAALGLPVAAAVAGEGTGTFTGASGHATAGSVEVIRTASGWEIRLGGDFSFDGAPDPRVGFGSGGVFAPGTDFDRLRAQSGAQVYKVPEGIDPTGFDEVYVWCQRYSVPLGVAKLGN